MAATEPLSKSNPAFGCVKNTIRLRSGRYFDLLSPQPDQFTLADIAGALAKVCRFGGQIDRFYSVAEHCLNCFELAARDGACVLVQRIALLHDAAEAFIGDVVKPLKVMLPEYEQVEARVEAVIAAKYGLFGANHAETIRAWDAAKEIDRAMLIAERRAFFSPDAVKWTGEDAVRAVGLVWQGSAPGAAENAFAGVAASLGAAD